MTAFIDCGGGASLGGIDTGDISHSLRFRSSASAYLSRTFGTPTNNKIATFSFWCKRGSLSTTQSLFSGYDGTSAVNFGILYLVTSDALQINMGGSSSVPLVTSPVYRDPSSHTHILVAIDTTQATSSNRVKIYVNGTQITAFSTTNYPALNQVIQFAMANGNNKIGTTWNAASAFFDGYLSRVCFVDGQALDPSSFGYLNTSINEWVSKSQSACKAVVDAGGTNSFMLDFDDASGHTTSSNTGIGKDLSTHGNYWVDNAISLTAGVTYDHMLDVPGNSFATLNPLRATSGALSYANLRFAAGASHLGVSGSMEIPSSGKWYYEATVLTTTSVSVGAGLGVCTASAALSGASPSGVYAGFAAEAGKYWTNGAATSGPAPVFTAGDVLQIAADSDNGKIWFGRNNSWWDASSGTTGNPSAGTNQTFTQSPSGMFPWADCYSETIDTNFGQRPFTYTPPTGFKALCQANLPDTGTVTVGGTFTGNANANGPFVWMNGVPKTLTINGNAVTFGTHADKLANGFKVRTSSASYNTAGSNTWAATIDSNLQNIFKYNNAEGNP